MKILIIEDDPIQNQVLCGFLQKEGYDTLGAYTLGAGRTALKTENIKLILLDLMLPDGNGMDFLLELRRTSKVPVIVLTSLDSDLTQLQVFDLKADDYIDKPVSPEIVSRRVRALMDRVYPKPNTATIKGFTLDFDHFTVKDSAQQPIPITSTEFKILAKLHQRQGAVLKREQLIEAVWGFEYRDEIRMLDPHIKNIRKKLAPDVILTLKGIGYRLNMEGSP